jgi:antitoxin (DNA-binding transcriptional repressor) of toxin-antitoxin stability system
LKSLPISEFKAKCIAKLKELQESGEELVITLRGQPIARVSPIHDAMQTLGGQIGCMTIHGDLLHSDLDDDFTDAELRRLSGDA